MVRTNFLLFAILFCGVAQIFGQTIDEAELVGTWHVNNIEGNLEVPDAQKEMMDALKIAFMESTFEFELDYNFTFDIDFIGIEDMMRKVNWSYSKEKSKIVIQEWADLERQNEGLMEIEVEQKNGKIFFKLTASPLILEVEKNEQ